MMQQTYCKPEDGYMQTQSQIITGSPNSGQSTSNVVSNRIKLQCAWRYSKSLEAWKLHSISIVTLTEQHISRLGRNVQLLTGTSMAIIRNTNSHQWCDYCKNHYGANTLKGQNLAMWVVIGVQGRKTFYCNSCVAEVTHWNCNCDKPRTCTNRFNLPDQVAYKQPPQVEMSFSNGI